MTLPDTPFTVAETHGRAMRPENELIAHSQDLGWRSLHAAIFREAPFDVQEPALRHPFIIYHMTHPTEVRRKIEGARPEQARLGPRNICVTPRDQYRMRHCGHPEFSRSTCGGRSTRRPSPRCSAATSLPPRLCRGSASSIPCSSSRPCARDALRLRRQQGRALLDTTAQMVAVHLRACTRSRHVPPVAAVPVVSRSDAAADRLHRGQTCTII